jgi:hypothetical protein
MHPSPPHPQIQKQKQKMMRAHDAQQSSRHTQCYIFTILQDAHGQFYIFSILQLYNF